MDRRAVVAGAMATGVALCARMESATAAAADSGDGWFAEHRLPIGLQLYTVGDAARQDINTTLQRVAGIGFRTIELAGYHGQDVTGLRAAANAAGVKFTSIHVNALARPGEPGLDQDIPRLAADLHVLGVTDVVLAMFAFPERLGAQRSGEAFPAYVQRVGNGMSRDDWQKLAATLNERGRKLRAEGLRFGYHNHNAELMPVDDSTGLEILLRETSPEDVTFEMDVGWVAAAGRDPVQLLLTHMKRFGLMHLKDIRASTKKNYGLQQDPTEVGSGSLEWRRILPAAFGSGVRKFYVEQEAPFSMDRFDAVATSYRFLRAFSF